MAMLPLRCSKMLWPCGITLSGVTCWRFSSSCTAPDSRLIQSSGYSCSGPRRGSWFSTATSSASVAWPLPCTLTVSPLVAATTLPPTTSRRCSMPSMNFSTMTSEPSGWASAKAALMSASCDSSSVTPRAWLPSDGLTVTGKPMSCATSQASSALFTIWPSGTGTPQEASRRLVKSLSCAIPSAMALVWSLSAVQMRRCAAP